MTHSQLVKIAENWLGSRCGVILPEYNAGMREIPDVIGFTKNGVSILVECKASRSDFLSDKNKLFRKKPHLGMGQYRLYCAPTGVIKVEDLPKKWGLITVSESGRARMIVNPFNSSGGKRYLAENKFKINEKAERKFMYSIIRRLYLRGRLQEIYEPLSRKKRR